MLLPASLAHIFVTGAAILGDPSLQLLAVIGLVELVAMVLLTSAVSRRAEAAAGAPLPAEPSPLFLAALANPLVGPDEANSAEWRAAELPAANGHATARAIAELYGIVAGRGAYDAEHRVLSPASAERIREGQGACRDLVLESGFRYETEIGLGLWLSGRTASYGPNPRAVGHDGAGGSCGLADPEADLSLGYAMNVMGYQIADDPRKMALIEAVYDSL
jgi:CubicO group peptidase (beta-lactamase class C family)